VTNNSAVILITQSCRQKFPERKQVVDSSPKITDICKIYWNGKEFKKGDASNNAEFKIIKIAGYEVEVINIGFPKAMYDEFKFEDNKGKALGGPYKGGNFMSENFQKILDICDIKS
jgi:hypothetical protein